jgi:hypothetical protein
MNSPIDKKHRPFSTGSQFADWTSRNCDSCKKGYDKKRSKFKCDYEFALGFSYVGDGMITEEIARAIGYLDNFNEEEECYIWECPGWSRRRN